MANMEMVKSHLKRLVATGMGEEAWEQLEAIHSELTHDEMQELKIWIAQNSYDASRPREDAEDNWAKWQIIAGYMSDGDTLRDVFPRLPEDLQQFLESAVQRSNA